MRVEVVVPEDYMGTVIADLNSRRGQMQGRESRGGTEIINVQVPLAEMFGYATEIRSRRRGAAALRCTSRITSRRRRTSRKKSLASVNGEKAKK